MTQKSNHKIIELSQTLREVHVDGVLIAVVLRRAGRTLCYHGVLKTNESIRNLVPLYIDQYICIGHTLEPATAEFVAEEESKVFEQSLIDARCMDIGRKNSVLVGSFKTEPILVHRPKKSPNCLKVRVAKTTVGTIHAVNGGILCESSSFGVKGVFVADMCKAVQFLTSNSFLNAPKRSM